MLGCHLLILVNLLGPGQVAQVQLGPLDHALLVDFVALEQELEDCVRPRALDIHLRLPRNPRPLAPLQQRQTIILVLNNKLAESLDIDSLHAVLPNIQWLLLLGVLKQVVYFLVVDLHEGHVDGDADVVAPDLFEEIGDASRDYAALKG